MNQKKELTKRTFSFGLNSILMSLVVIALVGVINFLGVQYPKKYDATKNKIHTFSDQSEKVLKGLKSDVTATFFGSFASKEKNRPVFENYKKLSNYFKLEVVDPNKEPTRTKQAGITKMDTLILAYQGRVSRVEDITEEKITNSIIKITKENQLVVCTVTGHGEGSFTATEATGFQAAKKGLEDQSYTVKEIILPQEPKIPADCGLVIMLGSDKAIFPAEIKALSEYLDQGGRLIVGLGAAITQMDQSGELRDLLKSWGFEIKSGLIIDPVSRMLGVDASVPIIAQFNPGQVIVKDFKQQCYFPFSRPVDITSPLPEGLIGNWLSKTTPKAWNETNMASLAKGEVTLDAADIKGPITTAAAVAGKKKDSKAPRETRIVVVGSSLFASNQYSRFGGNLDFFLNSASWALEDESLISIRAKEEDAGKIELSQNQGIAIFWISVIIAPLFIAILGIVIWVRRKKL